jgi:hypothetical protein
LIVVSDTSALIALAHLDLLPLLRQIFSTVWAPPAVEAEFIEFDGGRLASRLDRARSYILIRRPTESPLIERLRARLDLGESEALALAVELRANAFLMDELPRRGMAKELGRTAVGTLGVLAEACRRGLLAALRPQIERLRTELQSRISEHLASEALRQVGEV